MLDSKHCCDFKGSLSIAQPHQRDTLLRHFPFALSKAIYLGFQYLCPGNQSLFKGSFLCILNLSVFRLLTGVNICAKSVDSLRLKLYPKDEMKSKSVSHDQYADNSEHVLSSKSNYRADSFKRKRGHATNNSKKALSNRILRRDDPQYTEEKSHPRHQQVNFDVNQISPLLQQCLGRDCISLQPKRFIKRIEPLHPSTSSESTKQGATVESSYSDMSYLDELAEHQSDLKQKLKAAVDENKSSYRKARSAIARDKAKALKSREATQKIALNIIQKYK